MIKQGSGRQCFVCGFENPGGLHLHFYQTGEGEVTARVRLADTFQGWQGVVHGGVLAAMLDEAAGRAFLSGADLNRLLFTAKLTVRYRKPVRISDELVLVGKAGDERRGILQATSQITNTAGEVLAEAEVYLAPIPEQNLAGMSLNPDDWQVVPEETTPQ